MSKNLNYNTDCTKHFVRYNGWVEPYRVIKNFVDREVQNGSRQERCKYLTFCAVQAIDVFMLEKKKHLYRESGTNRLSNVYFFENDEEAYSIITKMIGSSTQGFFGDFKRIILQDLPDENTTATTEEFDEPESEEERETIRLVKLKKTLLEIFPFDVINLDLYGNFFPNYENQYSESCQAYKSVLELQKSVNNHECKRFLMFLTVYTPIELRHINEAAFETLERTIYENFSHKKFRDAFATKFGHNDPLTLEFYLRFIIGFIKQIIFKESYPIGWSPTIKDVFCYNRAKSSSGEEYKMTTFIIEYRRNIDLESIDFAGGIPTIVKEEYLNQLERIIFEKPINVPDTDDIPKEIEEDLKQIVEFRNEFLNEIGIYDEKIFS